MRIEDDGNARAWIAFAGPAPPTAVDLIRSFPEPLAIREHCGHAESALKQRLEEVHYATWERQDLVAEVSSGYDTATGVITVFVEPREPGDSASRSRLQHQLVADLPPGPANMPVDLRVLNKLTSSEDTVYGGRPLQSECTSGFNVVGVVTRGHNHRRALR